MEGRYFFEAGAGTAEQRRFTSKRRWAISREFHPPRISAGSFGQHLEALDERSQNNMNFQLKERSDCEGQIFITNIGNENKKL
jgi:hypothetical protein